MEDRDKEKRMFLALGGAATSLDGLVTGATAYSIGVWIGTIFPEFREFLDEAFESKEETATQIKELAQLVREITQTTLDLSVEESHQYVKDKLIESILDA
jgi:hypothetical protein